MAFKIDSKTLVINLITTFVLAVILELCVAYALRNPQVIPDAFLKPFQTFYRTEDRSIIQVTDCAEYNDELFYRLKPGTCVFKNREFEVVNDINTQGLRDDEESLKNPAIAVFGDSFTMGWGVEQAKSYPRLIEIASGERVLNAGISSYGTAREMKLLEKLKLDNLRSIIIQYHSNDYEENKTCEDHNYELPIRSRAQYDSLRSNIDGRNEYFLFKYLSGVSKSFARSFVEKKAVVPNDTVEAKTFLNILLRSDISQAATQIVLFKIDSYGANSDGFVNVVDYLLTKEPYSKLKISTVRVSDLFTEKDYFILDEHLNASGHEKLAARLNETLANRPEPLLVGND